MRLRRRPSAQIDEAISLAIPTSGNEGLTPTEIFLKTGCHYSTIMSFIARQGEAIMVTMRGRRKVYAWKVG